MSEEMNSALKRAVADYWPEGSPNFKRIASCNIFLYGQFDYQSWIINDAQETVRLAIVCAVAECHWRRCAEAFTENLLVRLPCLPYCHARDAIYAWTAAAAQTEEGTENAD